MESLTELLLTNLLNRTLLLMMFNVEDCYNLLLGIT